MIPRARGGVEVRHLGATVVRLLHVQCGAAPGDAGPTPLQGSILAGNGERRFGLVQVGPGISIQATYRDVEEGTLVVDYTVEVAEPVPAAAAGGACLEWTFDGAGGQADDAVDLREDGDGWTLRRGEEQALRVRMSPPIPGRWRSGPGGPAIRVPLVEPGAQPTRWHLRMSVHLPPGGTVEPVVE